MDEEERELQKEKPRASYVKAMDGRIRQERCKNTQVKEEIKEEWKK